MSASAAHFLLQFDEAVALQGSYTQGVFQRLVAAIYKLAPATEPKAMELFKLLAQKIQNQQKMLSTKYKFNPTMGDPYRSMKHMSQEINKQKAAGVRRPEVDVYAAPPEGDHPALTNDQNVMFRGVHDIIAHYFGQHPFSGRGEYAAYNRHLKTLPPAVAPILFTEIVGQTSVYKTYGTYTVQKAVIMNDFNPFRIGELDIKSPLNRFFVLDRKALTPRPDFKWEAFSHAFPKLAAELLRQPKFHPQDWENYNRMGDASLRNPKQPAPAGL